MHLSAFVLKVQSNLIILPLSALAHFVMRCEFDSSTGEAKMKPLIDAYTDVLVQVLELSNNDEFKSM